MMVMMLVLLVVMVTAAAMLIMVMMMVMLMGMLQLCQFLCQSGLTLHSLDQLGAGKLTPGSGDNGGLLVMLPDQGNRGIQLGLRCGIGTGENDGGSGFDLVVVELTKVLHIDLHLAGIADSNGVTQRHFLIHNLLHSADNIGQLAHTGGLNDDPVGVVLRDDLLQRLAEVAHQAAADAAGVHFGNVDAGILEETTINTNLTEFIFNQNQLLALVGFLDHLLDQCGLAGAQETGININFCHKNTF